MFVVRRYWSNTLLRSIPAFLLMYDSTLFRRNGLVPEISIEPTQDREPFRVVVDDVANGVQHVPAFGIHVA